jgi:hypothetical protein
MRKGSEFFQRYFPKVDKSRCKNDKLVFDTSAQHTNFSGNANQSHNEIDSPLLGWLLSKSQEISFVKGMEKRKPLLVYCWWECKLE